MKGEYNKCWKILSRHLELEKDKEGWRVWLSIMRIICQIERGEYIDVNMQIQSFRKYIHRWEQKAEIRERDKLVFKVLESLDRHHYDYEEVAKEQTDTLTVLAYPKGDLKWEANSPELILFHDWFDAKRNNQSYQPNYEPYRYKVERKKSINYLSNNQKVTQD